MVEQGLQVIHQEKTSFIKDLIFFHDFIFHLPHLSLIALVCIHKPTLDLTTAWLPIQFNLVFIENLLNFEDPLDGFYLLHEAFTA